MKDCQVLVVHDDDDLREVLVETLREHGFPVEQADDGDQALQKIKGGYRPDIILTDLVMPVMDGYQLNQELKRHPTWASIPLIIMTGLNPVPAGLADLEAVLQIPIDFAKLLERVRSACARKTASASAGAS